MLGYGAGRVAIVNDVPVVAKQNSLCVNYPYNILLLPIGTCFSCPPWVRIEWMKLSEKLLRKMLSWVIDLELWVVNAIRLLGDMAWFWLESLLIIAARVIHFMLVRRKVL